MTGPLPAGGYQVYAGGVQEGTGNMLQADLIYRASGDRVLGSLTSPSSGANVGTLDGTINASALDAKPGDLLVLHVSDTGGGYIELGVGLTIP